MSELLFSMNTVLPMIILISLGYLLKELGILNETINKGLNQLTFVVLIPVLLFYNIYNLTAFNLDLNLFIFVPVTLVLLFLMGLLLVRFIKTDQTNKALLVQSTFRTNATTIGLQSVILMGISEHATANLIAMTGVGTVLFNVLGVISFQLYEGNNTKIKVGSLLLRVLKNPIIIGISLGFIILAMRPFLNGFTIQYDLPPVYSAIKMVAQIASPLSLLALGATFSFGSMKSMGKEIGIGIFFRSVLTPVLVFSVAILFKDQFGFNQDHFPVILSVLIPSLAVTVVPMSHYMNGNIKLAGQLVVWTTITSTITMFVFIIILRALNLV